MSAPGTRPGDFIKPTNPLNGSVTTGAAPAADKPARRHESFPENAFHRMRRGGWTPPAPDTVE